VEIKKIRGGTREKNKPTQPVFFAETAVNQIGFDAIITAIGTTRKHKGGWERREKRGTMAT